MIPTAYPESMIKKEDVTPLYEKMEKETKKRTEEWNKILARNINANKSEFDDNFNQVMKKKEVEEYKEKLKIGVKQRNTEASSSFKPKYHIRKRMTSEHLNAFM